MTSTAGSACVSSHCIPYLTITARKHINVFDFFLLVSSGQIGVLLCSCDTIVAQRDSWCTSRGGHPCKGHTFEPPAV